MRRKSLRWLAVVALTGSWACAMPGDAPSDGPAPERSRRGHELETVDGLKLVHERRRGTLYVRPAHHIGSYDTIQFEPFTLSYKRGQQPLTEQETRKLGDQLMAELTKSAAAGGLLISGEPDKCTMSIQVHLVDLELLDLGASGGAETSFVSSAGSVMLIYEMRDALSRQPLVRYGQRRTLPGGSTLGVPGSLSTKGLSNAIAALLADVGREMQTAIPLTTRVRKVNCEGKLFKAVGRGRPVPR